MTRPRPEDYLPQYEIYVRRRISQRWRNLLNNLSIDDLVQDVLVRELHQISKGKGYIPKEPNPLSRLCSYATQATDWTMFNKIRDSQREMRIVNTLIDPDVDVYSCHSYGG